MRGMNDQHPIFRACVAAGGRGILAASLGVTRQAISGWAATQVPAERCPDIERITRGAVRCEDLRPDIDWGVLRRSEPQSA